MLSLRDKLRDRPRYVFGKNFGETLREIQFRPLEPIRKPLAIYLRGGSMPRNER